MAFTRDSERRIASTVTNYEKQRLSTSADRKNLQGNNGSLVVKTPLGGVPGRIDDTLGRAECTLYKATDHKLEGKTKVEVYNLSPAAKAGDAYFLAIRDRNGKFYLADAQDTTDGIIRVTFNQELTSDQTTTNVTVQYANLGGVEIGDVLTVNNYLRLDSNKGFVGYCQYWDSTKIDLIAARCPE